MDVTERGAASTARAHITEVFAHRWGIDFDAWVAERRAEDRSWRMIEHDLIAARVSLVPSATTIASWYEEADAVKAAR